MYTKKKICYSNQAKRKKKNKDVGWVTEFQALLLIRPSRRQKSILIIDNINKYIFMILLINLYININ